MLTSFGDFIENFQQGVDEYTSSLTIKKALYPPSSRDIATTHFMLALAYEFVPGRREDAIAAAEEARNVLGLKVEELGARSQELAGNDGGRESKDKELLEVQKELKELAPLIKDLDDKVRQSVYSCFPAAL